MHLAISRVFWVRQTRLFRPGGRGKDPSPSKDRRRDVFFVLRKENVAVVDEHRTSAMSNLPTTSAKSQYQEEKQDGTVRRSKFEVSGCADPQFLLRRQDRPPKLVDRDLNAALNIRVRDGWAFQSRSSVIIIIYGHHKAIGQVISLRIFISMSLCHSHIFKMRYRRIFIAKSFTPRP
jgi:hypothetical protein